MPIGPVAGTSDEAATYVDIAPGTGTEAIATKLEEAGVLRSRYIFDLLRVVKGGKLIAGEYRFNQPATAGEVYARMVRGDVYTIPVTIPEGYNIFDIAQAVESVGLGPREAVLAAERSQTGLIADLAPNATSLEGYLFPDTYRFGRHATPEQMVGAMVRRFRQVATQLGLTDRRLGERDRPHRHSCLDGRKRGQPGCGAFAGGRGIRQPFDQGDAAGHRSQRDLRCTAGRAISRRDLRLRPPVTFSVQHISSLRAASRTDLQSRDGRAGGCAGACAHRFSLFCCRCRGAQPLFGQR